MKGKVGLWSDPNPVQLQDSRHYTKSPLLYDSSGCRRSSEPTSGFVVGNSHCHIFEWPGCPYYEAISPDNQVPFPSPQAAEAAGYRPAHNLPVSAAPISSRSYGCGTIPPNGSDMKYRNPGCG
ncbi:Ada metal-binding domain-containing protein [Candidatus Binatus sp.]|uniref:Ada metal-binding domain-containing protein n=1 Tax=Candidatus Binatus sp. TaxID=2811406 RepID=UPI0039C89B42